MFEFLRKLWDSILSLFGRGKISVDPAPTKLRTDLYYGYFGSSEEQLAETKDHINFFMAAQWGGPDVQLKQVIEATAAGIPVMLDFSEPYKKYFVGAVPFDIAEGEIRVRNRFKELQDAGVLHNIIALYPVDEPELYGWTAEQIRATNEMLRRVMAEFNMSAKLAIFYTAAFTWMGVETYDWVGFDNYDAKENIFSNGDYLKLKKVLRSDQKIILIPGGCDKWQTDPTLFFNKAQADSQVVAIMPFIWLDNADPANGAFAGIRSNSMNAAYKSVGMKIKTGAV